MSKPFLNSAAFRSHCYPSFKSLEALETTIKHFSHPNHSVCLTSNKREFNSKDWERFLQQLGFMKFRLFAPTSHCWHNFRLSVSTIKFNRLIFEMCGKFLKLCVIIPFHLSLAFSNVIKWNIFIMSEHCLLFSSSSLIFIEGKKMTDPREMEEAQEFSASLPQKFIFFYANLELSRFLSAFKPAKGG